VTGWRIPSIQGGQSRFPGDLTAYDRRTLRVGILLLSGNEISLYKDEIGIEETT